MKRDGRAESGVSIWLLWLFMLFVETLSERLFDEAVVLVLLVVALVVGFELGGASRFMACGFVLIGGAGRAKGFGGPCAPAESSGLPALGDGGGRIWCCRCCGGGAKLLLVAVPRCEAVCAVEASADAPVPPPSSPECSLGICTFRRGRLASAAPPEPCALLLVRPCPRKLGVAPPLMGIGSGGVAVRERCPLASVDFALREGGLGADC